MEFYSHRRNGLTDTLYKALPFSKTAEVLIVMHKGKNSPKDLDNEYTAKSLTTTPW